MNIKRIYLIFATLLLAATSVLAKDFRVKNYGAKGDGKTDDGPAIQKAFDAAKKHAGPSAVVFEKKHYLLGDNPNAWHYFVLAGCKDLVIEGNGATLVCSDANLGFHFIGGKNITVRGLTLDVTAPRVTQGKIVALDKTGAIVVAGSFEETVSFGGPRPWVDEAVVLSITTTRVELLPWTAKGISLSAACFPT